LNGAKLENDQLSSKKNIDLEIDSDIQPPSNDNALLLISTGLISGFFISFVVVRILRRRHNKLNIISRSY